MVKDHRHESHPAGRHLSGPIDGDKAAGILAGAAEPTPPGPGQQPHLPPLECKLGTLEEGASPGQIVGRPSGRWPEKRKGGRGQTEGQEEFQQGGTSAGNGGHGNKMVVARHPG